MVIIVNVFVMTRGSMCFREILVKYLNCFAEHYIYLNLLLKK